jgi:hypothetical protein
MIRKWDEILLRFRRFKKNLPSWSMSRHIRTFRLDWLIGLRRDDNRQSSFIFVTRSVTRQPFTCTCCLLTLQGIVCCRWGEAWLDQLTVNRNRIVRTRVHRYVTWIDLVSRFCDSANLLLNGPYSWMDFSHFRCFYFLPGDSACDSNPRQRANLP